VIDRHQEAEAKGEESRCCVWVVACEERKNEKGSLGETPES